MARDGVGTIHSKKINFGFILFCLKAAGGGKASALHMRSEKIKRGNKEGNEAPRGGGKGEGRLQFLRI